MPTKVVPRIAGVDARFYGPFGEVEWSTGEHGCKDAAFSLHLPRGARPQGLTGRPLLELMLGPVPVWAGTLGEPDWPEGRFTAVGLWAGAERFEARDGSGNPTARGDEAIDRAQGDGWQVLGREGFTSTPLTDAEADVNKLAALLEGLSDEAGQRVMIHADRIVRMAADPTEPDHHIVPGVADLGVADDAYVSSLTVVYLDADGGVTTVEVSDPAAEARFGRVEATYPLTELGPISQAKAEAMGEGVLAKGRSRLGWTEPITVSPQQLTRGGRPASLATVRSGQLVRVHGVYDDLQFLNGRTYLDAVIGETALAAKVDMVTLSPVGKVATTHGEVMETALRLAMGKVTVA